MRRPDMEIDAFDTAFAEAVAAAENTPVVDAKTPEQVAEETKAAEIAPVTEAKTPEQLAEETKAAEETAKAEADKGKTPEQIAEETKAAEETAKAEADKAKQEELDAAIQARLDVKAEADAKAAADESAKKPPEETPEQKTAREQFEASIKPYEPTDAEKAAMDKFAKDFPDEFAAVEAKFKSMERTFNARVYQTAQALVQHMNAAVTQLTEGFNTDAEARHFEALHAAHADYDAVVGKIPEWIKTQPTYLQAALTSTYKDGTTKEVIALLADFKKATGVVVPTTPVVVATMPAVKSKPTGVDDLTPVSSRRVATSPKGTPDPNDYEGAFAEAAAAAEG